MEDRLSIKLDPQAEALLSLMAGSGAASEDMLAPHMLRVWLNESLRAFAARNVEVAEVRNLSVPGPACPIPVRVYKPIGAEAPRPACLVFFHGGAFLAGDLDTHDGLCRLLVRELAACVLAVGYRLAPEHRFPAAVEDAFAATGWAAAHAQELGIDAGRLALAGDSAGGTLAAVVTHLARADGGPTIRAQLLLYPMTQFDAQTDSRRAFGGLLLEARALQRGMGLYLPAAEDARDPRASPLVAEDFSGLPPAVIVTAGIDPYRDEAVLYARKLRAAGVAVQELNYERMFHGFLGAYGVLDAARAAVRDIAAALRAHLA